MFQVLSQFICQSKYLLHECHGCIWSCISWNYLTKSDSTWHVHFFLTHLQYINIYILTKNLDLDHFFMLSISYIKWEQNIKQMHMHINKHIMCKISCVKNGTPHWIWLFKIYIYSTYQSWRAWILWIKGFNIYQHLLNLIYF